MKTTIHDVARKAGVSTKTVSRVINNQGEIREKTRKHVQAVIDELGYRPNILARSLVRQRTHMLGVVTWGLNYSAAPLIVTGIEQRSRELGYSLLLNLLSDPAESNARPILDGLAAYCVDGIIYAIPDIGTNHDWAQPAILKNLPPVVFVTMRARPGLSSVSVDNRSGGFMATRHLIEQGRRRIGHICGPAHWWEVNERMAGWRDALQQAGMEVRAEQMSRGDWTVQTGAQAMQILLQQFPDIDAVFVSNDRMAVGALNAAIHAGRRVPEDLAIAGFDDIPESAYFNPSLTTICQPLAELGRAAVDLLHKEIENGRNGEDLAPPSGGSAILLEPELIVRASTSKCIK
jgi:LacI family transcriptional regulator